MQRVALGVVGAVSWAAGGVASFTDPGAGAAALIAVGAACGALALLGRWPTRINFSGNEFVWDDVRKTVDSQIEAAENSGETEDVVQELRSLRGRIDELQATGNVPDHPAAAYDRAVEAAIRRLIPNPRLRVEEARSRSIADFVLEDDAGELFVETKWRNDPSAPFRGSTLPDLLGNLPPGARLLVVVNSDSDRTMTAGETVSRHLNGLGRVVGWRDFRDDARLADALNDLLA